MDNTHRAPRIRHPGRVRLAYIDESYDRERFVLAAVIVDGAAAEAICHRLDGLVVWAHRKFGVPATTEIHAHPLLNLKGDWACLPHDPRLRLRMARTVVTGVVATGAEVAVAETGFTERGRAVAPTSRDAYRACLDALVRDIDMRAKQAGYRVVLVADDVSGADDYRDDVLAQRRSLGAVAEGSRIMDTIYFAPSGSSRMLQAVDMVAYLARRARAEGHSCRKLRPATDLWSEVAGIARWVTVPGNTSTPGDRG